MAGLLPNDLTKVAVTNKTRCLQRNSNRWPRKCLGYKTPVEIFIAYLRELADPLPSDRHIHLEWILQAFRAAGISTPFQWRNDNPFECIAKDDTMSALRYNACFIEKHQMYRAYLDASAATAVI